MSEEKDITRLTFKELCDCVEPSEDIIQRHMKETGNSYYGSREYLREQTYGGKPPRNYQSWGDYWKSI